MDEVDALLQDEQEEEDALLDEQFGQLDELDDSQVQAAEPVDEASWVRPALPDIHPDRDGVGALTRQGALLCMRVCMARCRQLHRSQNASPKSWQSACN